MELPFGLFSRGLREKATMGCGLISIVDIVCLVDALLSFQIERKF